MSDSHHLPELKDAVCSHVRAVAGMSPTSATNWKFGYGLSEGVWEKLAEKGGEHTKD